MANLVQPAHCLSVPHTLPSIGSVSLSLLLSSTVCPLSVSTSQCTVFWFCVTVSTDAFHSLFNVSQYLTMYRLFRSVSLCPLLLTTVCPLSVSTSVPPSTVWQFLTKYRLLVLCHYVHCRLLQFVHCLSVPHTIPSVGSLSLIPLLFSTVSPLSVSTSNCTVC